MSWLFFLKIEKMLAECQNVKYNISKGQIVKQIKKKQGVIMSNIADLIEDYILTRLAEQQTGQVELRRTDIADEISCAPSQISYVLNTRFTHDKGFSVESRRGLGGFIRVVRVPLKNIIYQDMLEKIDKDTEFVEIKAMLHYLIQHEMISTRECTLLLQTAKSAYENMPPEPRTKLLRSLFSTLAQFS